MKVIVVRSYVVPEKKGSTEIKSKEVVFHDFQLTLEGFSLTIASLYTQDERDMQQKAVNTLQRNILQSRSDLALHTDLDVGELQEVLGDVNNKLVHEGKGNTLTDDGLIGANDSMVSDSTHTSLEQGVHQSFSSGDVLLKML
nr:Pentatricopeptide repeat-containing protein, chloroplastic [Ipomoea batatas]